MLYLEELELRVDLNEPVDQNGTDPAVDVKPLKMHLLKHLQQIWQSTRIKYILWGYSCVEKYFIEGSTRFSVPTVNNQLLSPQPI